MAIIELTIQRPKEKKPVAPKKKKEVPKTETSEKKPKEEKIVEAEVIEEKKEILPPPAVDKRLKERKGEESRKEIKAETKESKISPEKGKKPKGFLEGIRGFFKRPKKGHKEE